MDERQIQVLIKAYGSDLLPLQEKALKEYEGLIDTEPHKGLFKKLKEKLK